MFYSKISFFILILFSFTLGISSQIYAYDFGGGGGSEECLQNSLLEADGYNFGNTYHSGILMQDIDSSLKQIFLNKCGFYSVGIDAENLTTKAFPVYHPKFGFLGYLVVYEGRYISGKNFSQFSFYSKKQSRGFIPIFGFIGGTIPYLSQMRQGAEPTYKLIKEKRFEEAYSIQWYSYLSRPMIVTRDVNGLVTDVFIQNKPSSKDSKEIAKKYLKEKWYHP